MQLTKELQLLMTTLLYCQKAVVCANLFALLTKIVNRIMLTIRPGLRWGLGRGG